MAARASEVLSANDILRLQWAMSKMECIELVRTYQGYTWTISTRRAGKAWPVAMLVHVRCEGPHMVWQQYFESVEALR